MIEKRELQAKARERNLSLLMIEKDYVLGWLLFGFSTFPDLIFKGGTALSKVYFPATWRLSEDLDFSLTQGDFERITAALQPRFEDVRRRSRLKLRLVSQFSNPGYLQLKIQYAGPIGRNWIKVDIRKDDLVDEPEQRRMATAYSDYPDFRFLVESLPEICVSKIRALIERKKARDHFDLLEALRPQARPRPSAPPAPQKAQDQRSPPTYACRTLPG